MPDASVDVAAALKALRRQRGWSLDDTAAHTGVSKAMLGQIERGESSPTVSTLWKIATGLGVPMTALIEPGFAAGDVLLVRDAAALRVQASAEGQQRALLFPYEPRFGFELYELVLAPGYESISEPHEPGVTEHVTVLHGAMELMIEGEWRPLAKGQSLRFPADRRHGYRNPTAGEVMLHDIIHYASPPRPR
jgi:transcriptional regulator with XRE-family HTH domain